MLRAVLLAAGLILGLSGPSLAQSNFDATGQFTLSFQFSQPDQNQEKPKPLLGFRFGASNVPQVRIEEEGDPTRRALNLEFDRSDGSIQNFAGVQLQFGEADEKTIRLLDDPFGASGLGLGDDTPAVVLDDARIADYLRIAPNAEDGGAWSLSIDRQNSFGWSATPLSD